MKIALIVAMTPERVIGYKGTMPWHLPADLAYFKKVTMGFPVMMGRVTYESLLVKPLPGRQNIVITANRTIEAPGCVKAAGIDEGFEHAKGTERIFVIGGARVYEQTMDCADELYITKIDAQLPGDTYFPEFELGQWRETSRIRRAPDMHNAYAMEFICLARRR